MNVLYGLKDAAIAADLKLDVARKVFGLDDEACLKAAVDLLGKINDEFLPSDAIAFLARMATEHSDPNRQLWRAEKEGEVAYFNGDILNCGINTVRGRAAEGIRDLLVADQRYLNAFLPMIERLVRDPNISVRACVASTLLGVALHDEELAVSLFHVLVETDDVLLATHYAEDFIRRGLPKYLPQMCPHIERMLRSEHAEARQAGARLASLARLYHEEADDLATTALSGDTASRLGVAEIAKTNLTHSDCREWCEQTLAVLFNDADATVL
ncbi:MAG TPA: hypothetical protein VIT00_11125 [Terrimicrobiaceae bacterium]